MRVIIAGSRCWVMYADIRRAVYRALRSWGCEGPLEVTNWITEVLSGTAPGADRHGERWAKEKGIPLRLFPADWEKHGKRAGFIRNHEMAKNADALVAIWDGKSRGTANMIAEAEKAGLKVYVFRIDRLNP